jgi:hypothetical protein
MLVSSRARIRPCAAAGLLLVAAGAHAGPIGFNDFASFAGAARAPVTTLDFESIAPDTPIAAGTGLGGIRFDYDLGGVSLKVTDDLAAPSGSNSLGTDDFEQFLDGDTLTLAFDPVGALGLLVIATATLLPGEVVLSAGGGSVSIDPAAPVAALPGDRWVYFLGLVVAGAGFDQALLSSGSLGAGNFAFNLDDISTAAPVSQPRTALLLGLGLLGLVAQRGRRRRGGAVMRG